MRIDDNGDKKLAEARQWPQAEYPHTSTVGSRSWSCGRYNSVLRSCFLPSAVGDRQTTTYRLTPP